MIDQFDGKYSFLSNFHLCTILMHGIEYPSAEHAYQAMKSIRSIDRALVASCPTPGRAKRLGGKLRLRYGWTTMRYDVMRTIVRKKFTSTNLRDMLLDTRDNELVEGNHWHDRYWGVCSCTNCTHMPNQNHLGKILMAVRTELGECND